MRKPYLVFFLVASLLFGKESLGQSFSLTDTVFQKDDTLRKTIYFDYDSFRLLPESELFLDSLAMVMHYFDSLIIQIESNTDDRGSDEYNYQLSERRARAIKDYLMFRKILPVRLVAVGNGEKDPLIPVKEIEAMKTEAEQEHARALNRQTVFRIIGFKK